MHPSTISTIQELANATTANHQKMEELFVINNLKHEDVKHPHGTIDLLQKQLSTVNYSPKNICH